MAKAAFPDKLIVQGTCGTTHSIDCDYSGGDDRLAACFILDMKIPLWATPRVRRVFGTTAALAASTKSMEANQGRYNWFLAAGLFWGMWQGAAGRNVVAFFLICVIVAGVYGAATVPRRISFMPAFPPFWP